MCLFTSIEHDTEHLQDQKIQFDTDIGAVKIR